MFKKINKTINLLCKLQNNSPRVPLVTIFKLLLKLHLDYRDILYDEAFNNFLHEKLELIQYNAVLAITRTIRGSSREKLYQGLDFESLQQWRRYRRLCFILKIIKNQSTKYLFELIPTARQACITRHKNSVPLYNVKHYCLGNSFFPSTVTE